MPAPHTSPLDALAEELGLVAGRIEREVSLRIDAVIADLRRVDAERELRLTNLVREVTDRLSAVKDGERGETGEPGLQGFRGLTGERGEKGETGERGLQGEKGLDGAAGADGAPAERGEKGDKGDVGESGPVGEQGPQGERGLPGDRGEKGEHGERGLQGEKGIDGAAGANGMPGDRGEKGERGATGLMPAVMAWSDTVHYEGQIRTHDGATYQAFRDTAKAPPHQDWICLAASGRNGADGRSFRVRETYSAEIKDYRGLDVVALGGAAFVARHDDPGACPGEGWQMIASQGKRGNPGERGAPGSRGAAGPAIEHMSIDAQGMLTLDNADGSKVECDLYPLLARLK